MTSNRFTTPQRLLMIGTVLLMVYMPFHGFFSVVLGVVSQQPLLIKGWKEILLGALVIMALFVLWRRPQLARWFWTDRVNQLVMALLVLEVILALVVPGSFLTKLAGIAIDTRYLLYFLLVRVVVGFAPKGIDYLWQAVGVAAIFVVGFGVLQQYFLPPDVLANVGYSASTIAPYLTVDNNPQYIRINATLRGPNPLGAYVMIIITALLAWTAARWKKWQRQQLIIMVLAALACTSVLYASYSRSAWLAAGVSAVLVAVMALPKRLQKVTGLFVAGVLAVGVIGYLALQNSSFVRTIINHKDPANASQVDSNLGHASSLAESSQRALAQPWGAGIGSTGSASLLGNAPVIIESQFLFVAHETGWLGLVLYLVILGMIIWRLWSKRPDWRAQAVLASGVGLIVIGLIQPVFVDDTIAYVWWGLAAAMVSLREPPTRRSGRE